MHAPRVRRTALALFASILLGTGGCVVGAGGCSWQPANSSATTTASVPITAATAIDAETANGGITVTRGTAPDAVVTANVRAVSQDRADAVRVVASTVDGVLVVRVEWPDGKRQPNEGCSLEVRVPDASGVRLATSNGALALDGLGGEADLRTSNGRITVTSHTGPVKAHTSNGAIRLAGVTAADAGSSNGRIEIELAADAPGPVTARTSNGAIVLTVGESFRGTVVADTSNGTVSDTSGLGLPVTLGRTTGTFRFGEGGEASALTSSNGSITIARRK